MELPMIHEASLRVLILSTTFLKEAAAHGLCLSEIGDMMSRQFTGKEEEPSALEVLCMEARNWVKERELLLPEPDFEEEDDDDDDCDAEDFTQFDLDSGDDAATCEGSFFNKYGTIGVSCRNPLSKLTEDIEEEHINDVRQDDVDACTSWSANEMMPPSSSFVKLSDMSGIEWSAFLGKFQELLLSMFRDRKQTAARGPWLMQRLGTSCQF
nr:unnamed protein product [Digitaria exilis]